MIWIGIGAYMLAGLSVLPAGKPTGAAALAAVVFLLGLVALIGWGAWLEHL